MWGHPEQEQADEGSDARWAGHAQGQAWLGGSVWGGCALLPKVYSKPCRDGSLSRVQGCAHTGLNLIWEQQGDWLGGRWGWPGRPVMPSARLPVPVFAEG